jgi:hypothetical protein
MADSDAQEQFLNVVQPTLLHFFPSFAWEVKKNGGEHRTGLHTSASISVIPQPPWRVHNKVDDIRQKSPKVPISLPQKVSY